MPSNISQEITACSCGEPLPSLPQYKLSNLHSWGSSVANVRSKCKPDSIGRVSCDSMIHLQEARRSGVKQSENIDEFG